MKHKRSLSTSYYLFGQGHPYTSVSYENQASYQTNIFKPQNVHRKKQIKCLKNKQKKLSSSIHKKEGQWLKHRRSFNLV
jgi:hypothetical protein